MISLEHLTISTLNFLMKDVSEITQVTLDFNFSGTKIHK